MEREGVTDVDGVVYANGHALLAKSDEKRGGRGKRELDISKISYSPPKAQMSGVTFHFESIPVSMCKDLTL